jgi:SAM-dependent methyltransferase
MSHLISDQRFRGFATYFWSMLSDVPRAKRYFEAIDAMCDAFYATEGRRPVVLDVGCGTGMLSILAALTGKVERVCGVDVNADVVKVAVANAKRVFKTRVGLGKFLDLRVVEASRPPADLPRADALLSEILGTLVHSEDAFKYVSLYARHALARHPSGETYIVPRRSVQMMKHRRFARVPPGLRVAVEEDVNAAWRQACWSPTTENGLSVLLHAFPCEERASAVVREEDYATTPPTLVRAHGALTCAEAYEEDLDLVLFEWSVQLWGDVWLHNTVEELREMARERPSSALARDSAWGFVAVPCFPQECMQARTSSVGLSVACNFARADGPPVGDFRDDDDASDGTPLGTCRYAADLDFCESLVDGFLGWLGAQAAQRGERLDAVLVYDDPTSGVLIDMLHARLGDRMHLVAYSRAGASHRNAVRAYPHLRSHLQQASHGWVQRVRALGAEGALCVLAPSRLHERGRPPFPVDAYPTYPPPVKNAKREEYALLPVRAFDDGVPGMAEAGVRTLMQTSKPFLAYNLFPSIAYTVPMESLAWLRRHGYVAQGHACHLVLHECDAPDVVPSGNLSRLRALARRDRHTADGVFADQLSLVARATASAVSTRFQFGTKKV